MTARTFLMTKPSRLVFDAVVILAVLALSFLPAVGTDEAHFAIASKSLRIIAGIYATIVLLGSAPRTRPVLGRTGRFLTDLGFAAFLGSMSWFETFPAGNHI